MERIVTIKATIEFTAAVPEDKVNYPLGSYCEDGDAILWIRGVGADEGGLVNACIIEQTIIAVE